jgi:hypothetical protein
MKIIIVGTMVGLLLCAAAGSAGYYVGKSARPISQAPVEKANSHREYLTRRLMEVKAETSAVRNGTDAFDNLKQTARKLRVASGRYLLDLKNLPDSPIHTIERECLADADEAIDRLKLAIMSVDSCEYIYFRTARFCSSNERADANNDRLRKTSEAAGTVDRCLAALLDAPTATAAVSR